MGAVADEADDVVDGRVVAEFEFVVVVDAVFLADGGEQFGLFDGVDAEVGFEVEVDGEHLGRVAGLFGDEGDDACGDRVDRRCRRLRRRRQVLDTVIGMTGATGAIGATEAQWEQWSRRGRRSTAGP